MLKRSVFAAIIFAAPALAQDADTVVATVNDMPITLGHMIEMKQGFGPQGATISNDELWPMMLDRMVDLAVIAQVGEEQSTAGDAARIELDRRDYLAKSALEKVAEAEPTDQEIADFYAKIFADADPVTEYDAAHILLESKETADEVKKLLDEGGDFGKLAEERSTGPSAPQKGELGWFTADQMVEPFAEAVKAMEKGQISDPVETQFGWHIIRLNDTRVQEAPKLEEVRDQIITQIRRDRVNAEVDRLKEAATIVETEGLDPALLDRVEYLDAQ